MRAELCHSIQTTLAYFEVFGYPLTKEELFERLWQPPRVGYAEYLAVLDGLAARREVGSRHGYFFLTSGEIDVEGRRRAVLLVEEKLGIARRVVRRLAWLPFVRLAAVCNTVAAGWPGPDSDIDLFIVVRAGRLWTTRFLITALASILNARRSRGAVANRVCLSFYVTDAGLDLSRVALPAPDIYLAYWINELIPLYERGSAMSDFVRANQWVLEYTPNSRAAPALIPRSKVEPGLIARLTQQTGEWILGGRLGTVLEGAARQTQKLMMARRDTDRTGSALHGVVIDDTMLKFHEHDRRAEYRQRWRERCQELSFGAGGERTSAGLSTGQTRF